MTTAQVERTKNAQITRHAPRPPVARVAVATVPPRDIEDARDAASVAALVAAVVLLIIGVITMATTSITAPPLRGFAMTAALASAPFVVVAIVYARHRLVPIAANRWR